MNISKKPMQPNIIVSIILFFVIILSSVLVPSFQALNYRGSSFISDDLYGYKTNFKKLVGEIVNSNIDIVIDNQTLSISNNAYKDFLLMDEDKNPYFEMWFVNSNDFELDDFYQKHFTKTYVSSSSRSKNFSFALFGRTKMYSFIYSPERYQTYKAFEKRIIGNYSNIRDRLDFSEFIGTSSDEKLNSFFDDVGSTAEKQNQIMMVLKIAIFSLLSLLLIKIVFFLFKAQPFNSLPLIIDALCVFIFVLIAQFALKFSGIELIILLSYILSNLGCYLANELKRNKE